MRFTVCKYRANCWIIAVVIITMVASVPANSTAAGRTKTGINNMPEFLSDMSTAELVTSVVLVIYGVCILVLFIKTLKNPKG